MKPQGEVVKSIGFEILCVGSKATGIGKGSYQETGGLDFWAGREGRGERFWMICSFLGFRCLWCFSIGMGCRISVFATILARYDYAWLYGRGTLGEGNQLGFLFLLLSFLQLSDFEEWQCDVFVKVDRNMRLNR